MFEKIKILEIKPDHFNFVSDTIERRWKVSKEQSDRYVNRYLKKQNTENCFVAICKDSPIGMGTFHINNDVGIDLHPWCIGLWVDPKFRGRGIGYQLTLRRFSWARTLGYEKIYLDTVNAENYHKKFGWKLTGLIGLNGDFPTTIMEYDLKYE